MEALAAAAAAPPAAPAAPAAEVIMPTWSSIPHQRDLQAARYIKRVRDRELPRDVAPAAAPAAGAAEARRLRLLALLAKAFPTSAGMPDPAGWQVAFKGRRGGAGYTFSHPAFCGGVKLYSLPQVARRAAAVMAQAQEEARANAAAGPALQPPGSGAVVARAAGTIAQVEQLLACNGVLAEFAAEHRCATIVDGRDGAPGALAAAPAGAADDAGEQAAEAEEEEERDATPLQAAVKRTRREVADDVFSTVLVGMTSSGKSALLNTALLLTEVDEHTYCSHEHKKDMPRLYLGGKECRLEAVGIIRDLLTREEGVKPDDLDNVLAACVDIKLPHMMTDPVARAAQIAEQRAHAGTNIYGRVERYLFGEKRLPDFLFPVGDLGDVTTRLATAARYGCQYHVFGHTYSKEELVEKLLLTAKRERDILQAHALGRPMKLNEQQTKERMEEFFLWNACVAEPLALGNGTLEESNFNRHANFEALDGLPLLFTRLQAPSASDVALHADVAPLLGRFNVFCGCGDLHVDRELARKALLAMQEPTSRGTYVYKKAYVLGPFNVLKGGKEVVDAPGTGDDTTLHVRHLEDACEAASHIVLVAPKNLKSPPETLKCMRSCGVLKRFLDGKVKLTVLHNLEKEGNQRLSLADFRGDGHEKRLAAEAAAAQKSIVALVAVMTQPEKGITTLSVDAVEALVRREVRVVTPYTMSYASLKFNAGTAALPDAAELLERTGGAALLGLLDGLNVQRVVGHIEAFASGPLAAACADVNTRLQALADTRSMTGSDALYKRAKKLMESGPHTEAGRQRAFIRRTLGEQFNVAPDKAPRALLRENLAHAFDAFSDGLQEHFCAQGDLAQRTHASWAFARGRKFVVKPGAQLATRELVQEQCLRALDAARGDTAGPRGMDLRNILLTHITLPDVLVDRLHIDVGAALDACAVACADLVSKQLGNLAHGGGAEADLMGTLLLDFTSSAGSDILKERLASVVAKVNERTLRTIVRRAKQKALSTECKRAVVATLPTTATDPSGVATYLDARLDTLLEALRAALSGDVQRLLDNVQQDAEGALRALETPRTPRAQVNGPTMPGMESYLMSGLGYIVQRLHPEHRAKTVDLLAGTKARGAEVTLRVQQLLGNLRAVQHDVAVLGRDAERLLDMHVLYRRLWRDFPDGGTLATRGQLNSDLPLPPDECTLYSHAAFAHGVGADRAHLQEVHAALEALPTPLQLRDTRGEEDAARATPGDSLWRALAHQLFASRNANENSPRLLKAVVLAKLLSYYASAAKNAEFTARPAGLGGGGLRVQEYVQAQQDGRLGAGMLELQMVCRTYGVQMLVWRSCEQASTPLLVLPDPARAPQLRAYNIVLEHAAAAPAGAVDVLQYTFRSTQRQARKKAVSMNEEQLEEVRVFSDPADKEARRMHYRDMGDSVPASKREHAAERAAEAAAKRPRNAGGVDDGDDITSGRAADAQKNSSQNKLLHKLLGANDA